MLITNSKVILSSLESMHKLKKLYGILKRL